MCSAIVCFQGCDVTNFEVKLIFLIILYDQKVPKTKEKDLNILRIKTAFKVKQKVLFIIFEVLSVAKNCIRPESALLIKNENRCTKKIYRNPRIENGFS